MAAQVACETPFEINNDDDAATPRLDSPVAARAETLTAAPLTAALREFAGGVARVGALPRADQVRLLRELVAAKDVPASLVAQVGGAVESSGAWRTHGAATRLADHRLVPPDSG